MTTPTPEPTLDAPDAPRDVVPDSPDGDGPGDVQDRSLSREAARYRRQLREVEAERDGLRARVERHQRGEVERLAADGLAVPGDLLAFGASLGDFLTEDGSVDAEAVAAGVAAALLERPGLAKAHPAKWPEMGQGYSRGAGAPTPPSWTSVLNGK